MQIYCAGVWHNFALCAAAWASILLLPWLLLPLYATSEGALVVASVLPGSPLEGALTAGARVLAIDDCPLLRLDDWAACLRASAQNTSWHQTGFCVPAATLASTRRRPSSGARVSQCERAQ